MNTKNALYTQLISLGVHVGSNRSTWNPNLLMYVLGSKDHVLVYDIRYTLYFLKKALTFVKCLSASYGSLLYVNCDFKTTPLTYIVKLLARNNKQSAISSNWMSGFLTNWKQILKQTLKSLFLKKYTIRETFIKILYLASYRKESVSFLDHMKSVGPYFRFSFFLFILN